MAVTASDAKLLKMNDKREAKRLRSILFDSETPLTFTPLHILFLSLSFIFVVFLLHILVKIFPATSPSQLLIAVLVLSFSIGVSAYLNKK